MSAAHKRVLLSSLAVALTINADGGASTTQVIIPDGKFSAPDGRPASDTNGKVTQWVMDADAAKAVLANAAATGRAICVDYEHGIVRRAPQGEAAPASGWIELPQKPTALSYQPSRGLVAEIDWTAPAATRIAAKELRYLSPVFLYDEDTGRIESLHSVALTNNPALGQLAVAALTAERVANSPQTNQGVRMDKTKICAALGLTADTADDSVLTALSALHAKAATAGTPDPTKFVAVAVLTAEQAEHAKTKTALAELTAKVADAELDAAITEAKGKGAVLTAQYEEHVRKVGKTMGVEQARAALAALPVSAALAGQSQSGGKTPAGAEDAAAGKGVAALSESQKAMATNLGVSDEAYAEELARQRAQGVQV